MLPDMTDSSNQRDYRMMYLGALVALDVAAIDNAARLAELTRSADEAIDVIERLRTGRDGDRVYPALAYLRGLRASEGVRA